MKFTKETGEYNEKRYSKPYIAVLELDTGSVDRWGHWLGEEGEEGLLEIEAQVGDVLMWGQKDYRNPNKGKPHYGILESDGSIKELTKMKAILEAREKKTTLLDTPLA